MEKKSYFFIGLLSVLIFCQMALAALLPLTPRCEVEASIIGLEEKFVDETGKFINYATEKSEKFYELKLNISKIGNMTFSGWKDQTCDNSFKIGQIVDVDGYKMMLLKDESQDLRINQIVKVQLTQVQDEFAEKPWFIIEDIRSEGGGVTIIKDVGKIAEEPIIFEKQTFWQKIISWFKGLFS